jgi:hypothetical protein
MDDNKKVRLYKIINNEETANNLINMYKQLKGKENLEKRIFLKTLVWCSLNPKSVRGDEHWLAPERYFHPNATWGGFGCSRFTDFWGMYEWGSFAFYNHNTHKVLGKLI